MTSVATQRAMMGLLSDSTHRDLTATEINSFRVLAVVERLTTHFRNGSRSESIEFCTLCLSLARGIDFAIANNDIPPRAQELPPLLKQVYHRKSELQIQAAVMVLMISVKNACKNGWFLVQDADELLTLANEMARNFCSPTDINLEPSSLPHVLSNVTSRFFPQMKIGDVLSSLEVKPGFGAFAVDFHIVKDKAGSAQEKIRLFVIQTDHTSTSSCLVNPPKVNFLLNGKGVDGRIDVAMDCGPQYPTDVTMHLKYGTNLLQAVGQFNGNYIIAIAFVAKITKSGVPALEDHVQPVSNTSESDSEIIEGSSRISLNCPISFTRIKTPVKGQLCKHPQCFDYENYIEINSRRPSWRCPHCNQSVCYLDIRIDQNIVKVLREVERNVSDIIISADGSWKPVTGSDKKKDEHQDKNLQNEPTTSASPRSSNSATVVDLTVEIPENDPMDTCGTLERKPSLDFLPGNPSGAFLRPPLGINTSEISQTTLQDDFWAGLYFHGSSSSAGSYSVPSLSNGAMTPVLTDAITPSFNREIADPRGSNQQVNRSSLSQTQQAYSPSNMQLQPSQFGCPVIHSDYGRQIPRNVARTPIAVQALPAQSSGAPSLDHQPFSRSISDISSSSMPQYPTSQNWDHHARAYMPPLQPPQIVGLPVPVSSQSPSMQRSMSMSHQNTSQNMSQQPAMSMSHQNTSQSMSQPPAMHSSHNRVINTGHHSGSVARSPPAVPVQLQPGSGSSFPMNTDGRMNMGPVNESPDQNWRPTGRMRGSLQGRAYSDALNTFFIQPNHSSPTDGNNDNSQIGNNINSQYHQHLQKAQQAYTDLMGTRQ